ncbi:MAG: MerR family transcriptional regulator [Candidatus Limnocylindria bacterium]
MQRHRTYQIGELAARVHLSLRTLRYWEEVGLITPSARSAGGFRLYTEENVQRVLLIKRMKPVDLTLEELRVLADAAEVLRAERVSPTERAEAARVVDGYIERIRSRCEILRERIDEAEIAAIDLEALIAEGPTANGGSAGAAG